MSFVDKVATCLKTAWGWSLGHVFFWDTAAAVSLFILAAGNIGIKEWVPAIPALWLLGRLYWERRRRLAFEAPPVVVQQKVS